MIKEIMLAGCGGFAGSVGRYLVGRWCAGLWHGSFPLATFGVNMAGCFVIGLLFGLMEHTRLLSPGANVLLVTGFCGGFTTFSSFSNEVWGLWAKGDWPTAVCYGVGSVVLGVLLVWGGRALVK